MNVAEYLVKKLKNNGVNHAFGIPGGVIIDFLYALDKGRWYISSFKLS